MIDALVQTFGRSHLLVLHFPIALFTIALVIELLHLAQPTLMRRGDAKDSRRAAPRASALVCLAFGVIVGGVAAGSGWVYAGAEFTPGGDLEWHRWLGICSIGAALLALLLGLLAATWPTTPATRVYQVMLVLVAFSVGWTGHVGGEMVHGEGYVLAPLTQPQSEQPFVFAPQGQTPSSRNDVKSRHDAEDSDDVAVTVSFESDVQPIFARFCYPCHSPAQARGDYCLDTPAHALKAMTPGDARASKLVHLISLPETDERSMPKNKPGLPPEAIAIISAWVDSLAGNAPVAAQAPEPVEPVHVPAPQVEPTGTALAFHAADAPIELSAPQRAARNEAIQRLRLRLIPANIRAHGLDGVEVRVFENRAAFDDRSIDWLAGLEPCLTVLDLTGTGVTDAGVARLASEFPRLRILRIGQTAVTDESMPALAGIGELALIDLHQTGVSASGLRVLAGSESLKAVRCWGTRATDDELRELSGSIESIEFDWGQ